MARQIAVGLALVVLWSLCSLLAHDPRPSVLLITVDTLRRDHVGLYGCPRETTPRLDAFFEHGTIVDHATSPAPCTLPAMKQVLSGALDFDRERPRLAEILREEGYATAAIVSQHHFRTEDGPVAAFERGFETFDVQGADEVDHHGMTARDGRQVSDRAIDWLDRRSRGTPFFLWLHYFDPHDPYWPPARYRVDAAPDESIDGDRRRRLLRAMKRALERADEETRRAIMAKTNPHTHFGAIFSEDEVQTLRAYYDAEIRYVDEQIGRVLERLEHENLHERTLVILTSDHGERLGEDDRWAHCQSLHGRELNVPLLLSYPTQTARESVAHAASTLDIMPTILDVAEVATDRLALDGRALPASSGERLIYSVWYGTRAIQSSQWKLTQSTDGRLALYDLERDPAETRDLADEEPARRDEMLEALTAAQQRTAGQQKRLRKTLTHLRELGYVQ